MTLRIFFPDTPPLPLPPGHRFPAEKYHLLYARLLAEGTFKPQHLAASPLATLDELQRAHSPEYVAGILNGTVPAAIIREIGLSWSETLVARSRATVGGTLAAARHALETGFSGQLAGGTHHAHRDRGAGFCVFNDCAVTALTLLQEQRIKCIAILDLDVHQGDGNASILGGNPAVFTASVHGAANYPFRKPPSSLDIGLADGADDATYLAACHQALDVVLAFRPEIILYIAGVDPLTSDRLGRLDVTHDGLIGRDQAVCEAARSTGIPLVVLAGGGYAEPISDTVTAYANTWRTALTVFG